MSLCNEDIIIEISPEGQDGRSINPVGEWSDEEQYHALDLVSYEGSSYVCRKTAPVGTLPTDTEYWMISASGQVIWGDISGTLSNQTDLQSALDSKADASAVYTKTETNTLLSGKADAGTSYTKAEDDALLSAKADKATTYTKTETDALLADKADVGDSYTKAEDDALLDAKADSSDVYTKTEADALMAEKANASAVYTKTETDTLLADKADTADLGALAFEDSVAYDDVTGTPTLGSMAGVDDAPSDGKEYARKNGAWAEVEGGGSGGGGDDKADVIIASASGAVASFSDGADGMPVAGLTVGIEPVQDLHGYDSPWPAGGGKNLLPDILPANAINASVDNSFKVVANPNTIMFSLPCEENTDYTLSDADTVGWSVSFNTKVAELGDTVTYKGSMTSKDTFTVNSGSNTYMVIIFTSQAYFDDHITTKCMIEKSSTATSYAPYSNICPISGWTGANIMKTGKNLWNPVDYGNMAIASASRKIANSNDWRLIYVPCKANTTYTVQKILSARFVVGWIKEMPVSGVDVYDMTTNNNGTTITITTGENAKYIVANVYNVPNETLTFDEVKATIQIETGSTATAYTPYTGTTLPISWQSESGTVYGGSLDVTTGAMVVDRAMVDLGTLTWSLSSLSGGRVYATVSDMLMGNTNIEYFDVLTDRYKSTNWNNNDYCISRYNEFIRARDSSLDGMTTAQVKTALTGTQAVYPLATAIIYQLTGEQITTLIGDNAIWSDTGDVSLTYRADTKRYVDGKIAESAKTTRKMIADSATADGKAPKNLSTGDLIIVGNELRKATANIGSGSAITASNSTTATLADVIKALQ